MACVILSSMGSLGRVRHPGTVGLGWTVDRWSGHQKWRGQRGSLCGVAGAQTGQKNGEGTLGLLANLKGMESQVLGLARFLPGGSGLAELDQSLDHILDDPIWGGGAGGDAHPDRALRQKGVFRCQLPS